MELAGKYMMEEFAPHVFTKSADPSRAFAAGRDAFSTRGLGAEAALYAGHPQVAFDSQGLGFSPYNSSY